MTNRIRGRITVNDTVGRREEIPKRDDVTECIIIIIIIKRDDVTECIIIIIINCVLVIADGADNHVGIQIRLEVVTMGDELLVAEQNRQAGRDKDDHQNTLGPLAWCIWHDFFIEM